MSINTGRCGWCVCDSIRVFDSSEFAVSSDGTVCALVFVRASQHLRCSR